MFNRVGGVLLIWDNDGMRPSSSTCATGWEEHVVAAERGCYLPPAASLCKLCCSFALLQHIASALTSNWIRNGSFKEYPHHAQLLSFMDKMGIFDWE